MKYRLVAGTFITRRSLAKGEPKGNRHNPNNLVRYKRDDIIESDEDLCAKFENKFEVVRDSDIPHVVTEARRQGVTALIAEGTWGEDDRAFLQGLSDKDFQRIIKNTATEPKEHVDKVKSIFGEDVTEEFPKAAAADLKVFRNPAGKFQVVKKTTPKKTLNKEALDQEHVEAFIEEFTAE